MLDVKVVPGASRTRVMGWLGEALKVAVAAPPEGGKANRAVCEVLAGVLGVPMGSVTVVSGLGHPRKRIRVEGLGREQVLQRLAAAGVV